MQAGAGADAGESGYCSLLCVCGAGETWKEGVKRAGGGGVAGLDVFQWEKKVKAVATQQKGIYNNYNPQSD